MSRVVLLLCLFVASALGHALVKREDENGAEEMVDELIYETMKDLKDKHQETITIPDFEQDIEKKWKFIKLRGELTGKGGWFKDVTTLKRVGKMDMKQDGNSISLGITLSLEDMEFGFKEYRAEIFHIGVHGTMSVTIAQNALYGHVTMNFDDNGGCKTTLDKIEVQKLDGFHVDMTGLGRDADWIYSYAVQYLANKYHDKIAKAVTDKLGPALNEALARKDICKKFPM